MSLVTSALTIGRSALLAYQSALQIVGNNVSNAGNTDYTRQSPVFRTLTGIQVAGGMIPGAGVTLTALKRNVDESLENRLRIALGDRAGALAGKESLGRLESVLNALSDNDLSGLLQGFFNALNALQNQPGDYAKRSQVLTAGASLAREIQRQRQDVIGLADEMNKTIADTVKRADELVQDIASLNLQITAIEGAGGPGASPLRDQRDAVLRELAELVQIQVREQPDGAINVYIGNEPVVQGGTARRLTATQEVVNGQSRMVVRFADANNPLDLRGGRIAGLVEARDIHVKGHLDALDSFATALIGEVNKVHAQGQGLQGFSSLTGVYAVNDAAAALDSVRAGLAIKPGNGSFQITVWDTQAQPPIGVTSTIRVDLDGLNGADDTLQSLVDQINSKASGVRATVTGDGRLAITADQGMRFTFAQDSSGVLGALGLNTFFTGRNAQDIQVNDLLASDPRLLAAATLFAPGDGSNAQRLAALESQIIEGLQGRSLTDYYNGIVSSVAVKGAAATAGVKATDAIAQSLTAQRESVSGVSLDEETVSLLRLERAFQGAARYTSVVDRLLQETMALVR